jgi:hypothetical protein
MTEQEANEFKKLIVEVDIFKAFRVFTIDELDTFTRLLIKLNEADEESEACDEKSND